MADDKKYITGWNMAGLTSQRLNTLLYNTDEAAINAKAGQNKETLILYYSLLHQVFVNVSPLMDIYLKKQVIELDEGKKIEDIDEIRIQFSRVVELIDKNNLTEALKKLIDIHVLVIYSLQYFKLLFMIEETTKPSMRLVGLMEAGHGNIKRINSNT